MLLFLDFAIEGTAVRCMQHLTAVPCEFKIRNSDVKCKNSFVPLRFKEFQFDLCADKEIIHFAAKTSDFGLKISGPFCN